MQRLILKKIFSIAGLSTLAFTILLVLGAWMTQSLRFIEIIIQQDINLSQYLLMISLLFPNLTATVLPICATLAILYTVQKLKNDHEFIVYQACGLSFTQLLYPILLLSMIVFSVSAYFNWYLGPQTTQKFTDIKKTFSKEFSTAIIREGVFNEFQKTIIYVKNQQSNNHLQSIYIYDKNLHQQERVTIIAHHGHLHFQDGQLILTLFDGCRQVMDPLNNYKHMVYFEELQYDLSNTLSVAHRSSPRLNPGVLNMFRLPADVDPNRAIRLRSEAHRRLINPLLCFVLMVSSAVFLYTTPYTRRTRWKDGSFIIAFSITLQVLVFYLTNSAGKHTYRAILAHALLLTLLSIALLRAYIPEFSLRRPQDVKP